MKYCVLVLPRATAESQKEPTSGLRNLILRAPLRGLMASKSVMETLGTFPERCPYAPENDFVEQEIRQHFYGKRLGRYRILFTINGDTVYILHVRHGARKRLEGPGDEGNPSEED